MRKPLSSMYGFPFQITVSKRNQTWGASETLFVLPHTDTAIFYCSQLFNSWSERLAYASHKPHALAWGY